MADFLEWARPFLKGITEMFDLSTRNKVLAPDETVEFRPGKKGYLISVSGIADTPFVKISQNLLGQKVEYSIFELYTYSKVTAPNTTIHFIPAYDTSNNIYTVIASLRPYKYYNESALIEIVAPSVNPITGLPITSNTTIIALTIQYIEINDLKLFRDSIKELLK